MAIYGHSEFSVYANPDVSGDGTTVLYDFYATFNQGKHTHNYTSVDGIAYLQTTSRTGGTDTQCLQSDFDDFPPINAIIAGINEATLVTSISTASIECESGNLFQVSASSIEFTLCATSQSKFKLYGSEMDIVVEYLSDRVDIKTPRLSIGEDMCEAEMEPISISSLGKSLLTGSPIVEKESRGLPVKLNISILSDGGQCSCKSTPRPCIFIHGLGVKDEVPGLETSLPYWGTIISKHAPCCTSIKYAHLNTVSYSWLNGTQQQQVCDRALAVSNSSTNGTIKDTIVVTHSMGSLMLAGGIATKRCALDPSSTWISTAAPMLGSMGSDYAQEVCGGDKNVLAEKVAEFKEQCPVQKATKSLAYKGGVHSDERLDMAYSIAQQVYRKHVYAVMCSESYSGVLSSYQAKFWILGKMIPHKSSKNDGTVEFHSCAKGLNVADFGDTYKSRFYRTHLNHYDMQFRGGDAFWSKSKKPVKWFECLL
ncbi:hypothetical protein PHMEG_00028433 [Phytophthora megakarya]|uniref:Uncharacterized protein n=1 Tax=Phytophthora megakarya TaxID=4795 RepID=A0A225V6I2_9STRA|nr:hypothetical protein PHMEG_00028433 [Phytophthora megakarya]